MLSKFASSSLRSAARRAAQRAAQGGPRQFSSSFDLFNPTEEHTMLRDSLRQFVESEVEPQATEFNRTETFNMDLFRKCGDMGLLGITVPVEHGGAGMDAVGAAIVCEELSYSDPAFCLSVLAHSSLFVNNLTWNANPDQLAKYLPDTISGAKIGGMGMSEPGVGTDVLGMTTTAQKQGDEYVLNGAKMWITNGAVNDTETGDVFLIYARTSDKGNDISLFLVEKDMAGFTLGTKIKDKLGMRASATAELSFQDVVVPAENLVGKEGGAVHCMMRNLELERVVLAAMSLGIARRSIDVMSGYAQERKAFGKSINQFGQVQRMIAESYAQYQAGRSYVYNFANQMDLTQAGTRLDSDGVKLFCAPMGKLAADNAIQVLGGNGYTGEYIVERLWRDAKLLEIGGGTNEAHHKNMTRDLVQLGQLP